MREKIVALASKRATAHHAGLLLQRYLAEPATGDDGNPKERRDILNAARQAGKSEKLCTIYSDAYYRWNSSFPSHGLHQTDTLNTRGRLIVGLGSENVLETGLRLHHTYGTPIIPGSALKGLTAHYCDQIWGQRGTAEAAPENLPYRSDGNFHNFVFGTTEERGSVTFHDAWITPDSLKKGALQLDVMTPHHSDWQLNKAPPTDFDNPKPVSFLSVSGEFLIRLSWTGTVETPEDEASAATWLSQAMAILKEALAEWGIGGKTSSGYGRLFVPPPPPPPPPPKKRNSLEPARVKIIAARPKVGFDVQDVEPGRNAGTLTLGTPPAGIDTTPGAVVDVFVHIDELKRPQYKWPQPPRM